MDDVATVRNACVTSMLAMTRGFQTRDGEMALARMVGELADR